LTSKKYIRNSKQNEQKKEFGKTIQTKTIRQSAYKIRAKHYSIWLDRIAEFLKLWLKRLMKTKV
jgi:hypothetical protein